MRQGDTLFVGDTPLTFVRYPRYGEAHPDEPCDGTHCDRCAIARRHDTGELVLLWLCEGKNWTVSRHDPQWARHREEIHAVVATDNRMAA
jgi:hypothetical protein